MRDELVGYLLRALEPDQHEEVQQYLNSSPDAREDLEKLRRTLSLLEADAGHHDPPIGLAHRTCQFVHERNHVTDEIGAGAASSGWGLRDLVFAAGTCVAASLVLMVAVSSSRRQVQRQLCERNLQVLAMAMHNYSDVYHGYFPYVSASGPLASAGVYAPTLVDSGQITDASVFYCPGDDHHGDQPVPTRAQLFELWPSADRFREVSRTMGGSYGYAFGYIDGGRYYGRRDGRSPYRALLADQPPRPAEAAKHNNSPNHGGRGQNVLFEDGRIQFFTDGVRAPGDHIYVNYNGEMAAGIGEDDTVVGYSEKRPF